MSHIWNLRDHLCINSSIAASTVQIRLAILQSIESKMNRLIIIMFATITMALYGKAHCCSSTYVQNIVVLQEQQYNSAIKCLNTNCDEAVCDFIKAAELTNNQLTCMINNEAFKFDPDVSVKDRSVCAITLHLIFNLFTENNASTKQ